jgi:NAD(P)H-dependent flavin oxidoreductase YrpB (nitropropane dioxygenase family)
LNSFTIGDLTIPVPIIQGGMGIGISLSGLASAVANIGGIGTISTVGIGFIENSAKSYREKHIDAIRREIRTARKKTSGILGVNIMTVITNYSDTVKISIEEGIDIIFSGAGLPLDLPKYLPEGSRTKLIPIISSSRAAGIICSKWKQNFNYLPDAFVVEGPKAGGHLGFKSDELHNENNKLENILNDVILLTKSMKDKYNKDIPVIAAGGIFTGEDIFNILKRGASAVQMGTRFIATEECDASLEFKKALIKSKDEDIRIIQSPVGMPGRAIFNKFLLESYDGTRKPQSCKFHCIKTCDPKTTSYCIAAALIAAYKGDLSNGFVFTGSNAGKVSEISTVKKVFQQIMMEYQKAEKLFKTKVLNSVTPC